MAIKFTGTIRAEMKEEFHRLYMDEPPWKKIINPILFSVAALYWLMWACANVEPFDLFTRQGAGIATEGSQLWERIVMVFVGLLCVFIAFHRQSVWWNWWWKKFAGREFAGSASVDGVTIEPMETVTPWRAFSEARASDTGVLLITKDGKGWGLPIHRSMFDNNADWQRFKEVVCAPGLKVRTCVSK